LKVSLASSGTKKEAGRPRTVASGSTGAGRNRAAEHPVVRRMQEKFGAEIRTIIDHREKR
jgi:hypothetical protein